jgi:exodeoxyribonuclease VIII
MLHPVARELLMGASTELTLQWLDEETGVSCKGRIDVLTANGGILVDLKTARDIRPDVFMRSCLNLGYAFSMAFYADGLAVLGHKIEHVYLLAVETSAPYDCAPYELDDSWLELGRAQYRDALVKLVECRKRDKWPGLVPSEAYLPFPKWAVPDDEKDALDGLEFDGGEE